VLHFNHNIIFPLPLKDKERSLYFCYGKLCLWFFP